MDGLRSINKRRRAFHAPTMKKSRRKFAIGGLVNPYEETYDKVTSQFLKSPTTDADTRTALTGDAVPQTEMPVGESAYAGGGRAEEPYRGLRPLRRPEKPEPLDTPEQMREFAGSMSGLGPRAVSHKFAAGGHVPPGGNNKQHPVGKALGRVPRGLKGYQEGGLVDEEEEELYRSPSGVKAVAPPTPAPPDPAMTATAGLREAPPPPEPPGYQGQMEGLPPLPDPQELRRRQSVLRGGTTAVPPSAPGTFGVPPANAVLQPVLEAQTGVNPLPPPPITDPARDKMLDYFGLRAGSTKDTPVEGSPGVTKYKDPATGKTLYANTTNTGVMAPTPEMVKEAQGRAKADSERLTGLVAARAASGHPADIEMARRLAVTPEQRMLVADAENMAGLRARAAAGGPGGRAAQLELQGRQAAQVEGLRGQRALQTAMLGRIPTPLELAANARAERGDVRAERGDVRAAAQEQRTNNLKLVNDTIEGNFTPDDRGKAEAADFRQNLTATLPHIKGTGGDLSKLNPNTLAILFSLNALRKNASPGSISQFFGADPASKNLLDFVPKDTAASFWRTQIRTPQGINTLGELAGGRKDLKDFIARMLAEQGVGGG